MTSLSILIFCSAYLLGSISSAVLICRLFRLPDPRNTGSNNPGATNVLRIGGRLPAALVLIFDVLKGTLPVYLGYFLGLSPIVLGLVGLAACLGHIYPLYFNFKGGKGVATAIGAMLPLGWELSSILLGCWLVMIFISGYSSLAAIISVSLAPIVTWFIKPDYTVPVTMLCLLIIVRHKQNITRLLNGQESKVWDKGRTKE
ncbi:glycerol-3-phosphate 1-O-acyltransferase PlsY [Paraglaciecola sp. L1A13]|uniref:glycerol-3-phosphate 1-O-acyltransferase PlsY n=1 Tax=Paraglaciecola sp. L1A13 TaxID=2686359 RepID=UPI00131E178D|nr:glycerol-3-phosphate 1-O-acyltransferase PlsY [Paraglaciecola sp. L1A13]